MLSSIGSDVIKAIQLSMLYHRVPKNPAKFARTRSLISQHLRSRQMGAQKALFLGIPITVNFSPVAPGRPVSFNRLCTLPPGKPMPQALCLSRPSAPDDTSIDAEGLENRCFLRVLDRQEGFSGPAKNPRLRKFRAAGLQRRVRVPSSAPYLSLVCPPLPSSPISGTVRARNGRILSSLPERPAPSPAPATAEPTSLFLCFRALISGRIRACGLRAVRWSTGLR